MMQRRLFFTILAATVFVTALGGATDRASGAIRLTISDGTETKYFYSPTDTLVFGDTTIGEYEVQGNVTGTNLLNPSDPAYLSQTMILNGEGDLPTLTSFAEVIDGSSLGFTMGEITGGDVTTLFSAPLAEFQVPGTPVIRVITDVGGSEIDSDGTIRLVTYVNETPLLPGPFVVQDNKTEAEQTNLLVNLDGDFTLQNLLTLSGVTNGLTGDIISGTSQVFGTDIPPEQVELIPEPGSLSALSLAALGLVWAARRRFVPAVKG